MKVRTVAAGISALNFVNISIAFVPVAEHCIPDKFALVCVQDVVELAVLGIAISAGKVIAILDKAGSGCPVVIEKL